MLLSEDAPPRRAAAADGWYRAVWRWHFYAGLLVLPFLAWLAVTGGLYLYKPEIERAVYGSWTTTTPAGSVLPLATLIERVERQTGARVEQVERPAARHESWRMQLAPAAAPQRTAFVDPYRGTVVGTTPKGGLMQTVRDLHGLAITGPFGNALIEVVAGWAILLTATGVYLWWPRGSSPTLGVRGSPLRRLFWRDLHATTGILAGAVIAFLALTGLPWSTLWGGAVRGIVADAGLGRPAPPSAGGGDHGGHTTALPWTLQHRPAPHGTSGDIGVDRAAQVAERQGLRVPWTLRLPASSGAPYLFAPVAHRAQDGRALYIDAGSGRVLQDAHFAQFGAGAQAIEWGIATHQGQQYGEPNRLLMLAGCLSIILLAVSAAVMWWKRRPAGRLGTPPPPRNPAALRGLAAIMLAAGVLFPLTGLSMLVALVLDAAVRRAPRIA